MAIRPARDGGEEGGLDPVVLAAAFAALALRLAGLGRAPLWFDETYTATWVALPWADGLRESLEANHLPLYFLLLGAWSAVAGTSPWALRLPGVLFSVATVPLVAAIARLAAGRDAGRRAAWLAAILPFAIHHAQEARMYALVAMLAAATTLGLLRAIEPGSRGSSTALVAAGVALAASHYYGAVFVAVAVAILVANPEARVERRGAIAALVATVAVAAALAWRFGKPGEAGARYDLGLSVLPGLAWAMVGGCTLVPQPAQAHALGARAALPWLPLAIPGLFAAGALVLLARRTARPWAWWTLVGLAAASIATPVAASMAVGGGTSPRYASPGLPALAALLGAGMAFSRAHVARLVATAVVLASAALGSTLHVARPGHGREAVDVAGAWIDANAAPGAPIVVTSEEMATLARFHWPSRPVVPHPPFGVVADEANATALADELPFPAGERVLFVFGRDWLTDPAGALRAELARRWRSCGGAEFEGIRVLCLERASADPAVANPPSPG
ncbi:MAG: glycosyltransferase family 39 protein [Alphaproteobacteria bacterium]